jgi:hypothetical protein
VTTEEFEGRNEEAAAVLGNSSPASTGGNQFLTRKEQSNGKEAQ